MSHCRCRYLIFVIAIMLMAFAARCATAVWWQSRLQQQGEHFAFGDSESYWRLAITIASGEPYAYGGEDGRIFRVPLYPLMIAPWIDLADPYGNVLPVRIMGALLGAITVGGIILFTLQTFGKPASLCAGLLAAFHPGAISMSILVLSEAPFGPLMIGNLLLWRWGTKCNALGRSLSIAWLAGCIAGLAVLARPSWLLFAPFAGLLQFAVFRDRRTVGFGLAMLAGFVLVMSPWWVRNYRTTGRFVLTTLQVGGSMYDGLHPGATGASDTGMAFVTQFMIQQRKADADAIASGKSPESTFEYRLNARLANAARTWAIENPKEVLRLAIIKIGRTWRPWPAAEEASGRLLSIATTIGFVAVIVPAAIGLWRYRHRGWEIVFLLMPAIYFTLLHAVFIGSMRYRLPAMLFLTVAAGPVWAGWLSRLIDWKTFVGDPAAAAEVSDGEADCEGST